jgi:NAD(P)-dependent dehydrogenase (short-subunit alcohol dehydrogenase family)
LHLKGLPEHGTYAATKAAVRSFARTWAMELKERGIRVNTLVARRHRYADHRRPVQDQRGSRRRARHFFCDASPRLAASAARRKWRRPFLFLASDDSSYSTGIDLVADGGITQL